VIPQKWLSFFNSQELSFLICGSSNNNVSFDITDLRKNCHYSNGYFLDHPTITLFWIVISEFTATEKSLLLKFVTSCSRVCTFFY
jgi:ubiquitin-protein ligase E3 C